MNIFYLSVFMFLFVTQIFGQENTPLAQYPGENMVPLAPFPSTIQPPLLTPTVQPYNASFVPSTTNSTLNSTIPGPPTVQKQQNPQDDDDIKEINEFNLMENGNLTVLNNYANRNPYITEEGDNDPKMEFIRQYPCIRRSNERICYSMNIVSNISDFEQLENCTVVEGYINILTVLATEKDFENISFPMLKEITDYLSVVDVYGLKSLGKLFPNLAVIRGNNQFLKGYSLIVVDNPHLEEIGLTELNHIDRGAVRINNNRNLCFADTIDWSLIAPHTSHPFHYIQNNKPGFRCENCPNEANGRICYEAISLENSFYDDRRRLCWNAKNCQKICPASCREHGCNDKGECCHPSCLGGCSEIKSVRHCTSCERYKYNDVCMKSCPENYFKVNDRRCVSFNDCRSLKRPLNIFTGTRTYELHPYFTYEDMCVIDCPPHHQYNPHSQVDPSQNYYNTMMKTKACQAIKDSDQHKYCNGLYANNTNQLRELEGCTHIRGSITLAIEGKINLGAAKTEQQFYEKYLGSIQVIEGHLAIVGVESIKTLHIFKHLHLIKGKSLHNEKYAVFLYYNENIEALFHTKHHIEIYKGALFFAMNPSLCDSRIRRFQQSSTEISGSCCDTIVIGNDDEC